MGRSRTFSSPSPPWTQHYLLGSQDKPGTPEILMGITAHILGISCRSGDASLAKTDATRASLSSVSLSCQVSKKVCRALLCWRPRDQPWPKPRGQPYLEQPCSAFPLRLTASLITRPILIAGASLLAHLATLILDPIAAERGGSGSLFTHDGLKKIYFLSATGGKKKPKFGPGLV